MKRLIEILFVVFLLGCDDKFLETEPSDQVNVEIFFTQEKDFELALNSVYDELDFTGRWFGPRALWLEGISDNSKTNHPWNYGWNEARGVSDATNSMSNDFWAVNWRAIMKTNRILDNEGTEIKDADPDKMARLYAETRFLRAYYYAELTMLFGDVPLLTSQISPDEAKEVVKSSQSEVLDFLANDLEQAAAALPIVHEQSDMGRATKGAALALRARLLMYNEKYSDAYAAAQQVMDMNYELYSDYEALFNDYDAQANDEVIFSIQYNEEDDVNNWITLDMEPQSAGGWSSQVPTKALIDAYECIDGLTIDKSPLYDWTNPYQNRDPRLHASVYYPGREYMGGTFNSDPTKTFPDEIAGDKITAGGGQQWNKTSTGYNWVKFVMKQDLGNGGVWTGHAHFPLIRYSEVLLTYAESKIEDGSIDNSVLDAINEIRQRAGMPDVTTMNATELREIVRRERRIELALEGLRLYDIRRWRIAENVMNGPVYGIFYPDPADPASEFARWVEDRVFTSRHYLLPIPQSEIDVSGIEQNPGW